MEPINVIVVDMPRMVREIVRHAVDAEADMLVAAEPPTTEDALDALDVVAGPVVIVAASDLADERIHTLLRRVPDGAVLTIAAAGGTLEAHQLRPVRSPLGEAAPARLVDAIRAAVGAGARP